MIGPERFLARPRSGRWFLLILILWLALFLRVWQLDVLPPGLHYDEAFNGTMARDVLRGNNRPIFFTANFGEEPLHIYTEALLFALVGESPWSIRLASALFGVLTVAAVYACARAFFPNSDRIAIASAFIAATLYWAINFSRIGIETVGLPLPLTLSAAALAHAYRKMSWRWIIAAGFLIGATVYTYLASRLWLPAVFLWFVYLLIFHRGSVRQHFSKWVVIGLVALVTLAPLALFFLANPIAFAGRSGTVFTPETFLTNLARTAGMFSFSGDLDPRDNLAGRPALDLLLSVLFVVGLILSLARFRKPFYAFLVIWLVVMSLPSALTEFAPNFRRAIGAMPAAVLLCALGVDWLWARIDTLALSGPRGIRLAGFLLPVALAVSAFWSMRAYFIDWASGPGLYYSFDVGLYQLANALKARPSDEDLYLTPDYDEHYTVIWALDGRPVSSFDGRRALVLPNSSRAASYGIITREDTGSLSNLQASLLTKLVLALRDYTRTPYATLLEIPPAAIAFPRPVARWDGFAGLVDYAISPAVPRAGEDLTVSLQWLALRPADRDYTVSIQLLGPPNPATGSFLWAQQDKQPGDKTYPTTRWREGESILEAFSLKVPPEAPAGAYKLQVGMYLLESGERVPVFDGAGAPLADDVFPLAAFELK